MLVLAEAGARNALAAKPSLDRDATRKLAEALFPGETLEPIGNTPSGRWTPRDKAPRRAPNLEYMDS